MDGWTNDLASHLSITDDEIQRHNAYLAMHNVTIPDGQEPDGAVAALWQMLKRLEWSDEKQLGVLVYPACPECTAHVKSENPEHFPDCKLDAALARFEVAGDASTRDGDGPRGE